MLYFICEDCKNKINYVTLHPKYVIKMNKRKIYYLLHNGKNSNLKYFIKGYLREMEIARYFDQSLKWILKSGDITNLFPVPYVVKSRPLGNDNYNSTILKLEKVRHFLFLDDKKPWREKKNLTIFRGDLGPRKENRDIFMAKFADGHSPLVDAASTNRIETHPEWQKGKMTIGEHLDYKFIMSLEGNDVASNLKWVMSSNCIAVSPRHTCETWFMEGTLKPNYHYIEVNDDFSNLEERLQYYIDHPDSQTDDTNNLRA